MERLEAGLDRQFGQFLADREIVGDEFVDRYAERVSDSLGHQIQRNDLRVNATDAPPDLEWAEAVVDEVAKELSPCATLGS